MTQSPIWSSWKRFIRRYSHWEPRPRIPAYDFPLAHRELEKLGITFFVRPQAVHDRTQVEFKRNAFSYQPDQDSYLCPQGKH